MTLARILSFYYTDTIHVYRNPPVNKLMGSYQNPFGLTTRVLCTFLF
jgi:hypothetical protein